MRITHRWQFNEAIRRMGAGQSAMADAQRRLATGKAFDRPSADPIGMSQAMELRSALRVKEQAATNAADGEMWVNVADAKLQTVSERLQRAKELAVTGASFASATEQQAIAIEVAEIRDQLVEIANAQHQGRRIFGGFGAGAPVTNVAGTWTFTGDTGAVMRRIDDDETVQVNVTADDVFGFNAGNDIFTVLDDFETAALAGDQAAMGAAIADIDAALERNLGALARLGSAGRRIDAAQDRFLDEINTLRSQLTQIEDVDISEAVMDLKLRESAYQTTLAVFARSAQASLVDFLR